LLDKEAETLWLKIQFQQMMQGNRDLALDLWAHSSSSSCFFVTIRSSLSSLCLICCCHCCCVSFIVIMLGLSSLSCFFHMSHSYIHTLMYIACFECPTVCQSLPSMIQVLLSEFFQTLARSLKHLADI
jgi:hypothetical protein